ncbi:MAG TPA: DNA-binding response regulator [Bacteroidales bacterium]|nr:DNA-binding response regulator [Bacteroidales bacterium]
MENRKDKILLVEDDKNLGFIISDYLEMSGYEVVHCTDGMQGLKAFTEGSYDLCLLDIMMPLKDGFTLANDIRTSGSDVPIIFITAKSLKEDLLKGFKLGADDYIMKPFSTEELLVRIDAVMRRYNQSRPKVEKRNVFQIGLYVFDYENKTLALNKNEIHLTKRESDVLKMLSENANTVLKREVALKAIWGENDYFMGRSMDVYITKLRKYLKDDPTVNILNIHGTGFKLEIK